jgi:type I restriction enzyme R subunit
MEHAIRKHLKINLTTDPVRYGKLSDKLDALIAAYEDNWVQLAIELERLRQEADDHPTIRDDGVTPEAAPYYDLIAQIAWAPTSRPKKSKQ